MRLPLLALLLPLAGCTAYRQHLRDGDALADEHRWGDAEQEYKEAQEDDPARSEAPARVHALHERWAAELVQSGEARQKAGDLEGATRAFRRALEVQPEGPLATTALARNLDARAQRAQALADRGEAEAALEAFDAILRIAPQHALATHGRDQVATLLAQRAFQAGEAYEKKGRLGNALVELAKAERLRPGATGAREREDAVRRALLEKVGFVVVEAPVIDQAHAAEVAERLGSTRLAALIPAGAPVRVLTQAPPGAKGVRLAVSVDEVHYDYQKEVEQRTVQYQAGTQLVPNTRRAALERNLEDVERTLMDAENEAAESSRRLSRAEDGLEHVREDLDRCWAEVLAACQQRAQGCDPGRCQSIVADVANRRKEVDGLREHLDAALEHAEHHRDDAQHAREQVYREPFANEETRFANFSYDEEIHHAAVLGTVTWTLTGLGEPEDSGVSEDFEAADQDATHPAYAQYGVAADPLKIKSEAVLRRELADQILASMLARVRERFDAYRDRLINDAHRQLARGASTEDAVEASVAAILVSAEDPPADLLAAVAKARQIEDPLVLVTK